MELRHLSPSTLEQARMCEARLAGRLGQIEGEEFDEDKGEGALTGTLAHAAAKVWYRPNEQWVEAMKQAITALKAAGTQDLEAEVAKANQALAAKGIFKHPVIDPDAAFRQAMDDCVKGFYGNELPKSAEAVSDAKVLFQTIISHYNRDKLNVVFAERRYKGVLNKDGHSSGVPVHLIIDLGVDRGGGRLELIDYKTGNIAVTEEEMYDKDQVLLNLLAVTRYDPELDVYPFKSFTYYYPRKGYEVGPVPLTAEQLIDYEHYLALTYTYLLDLKDPKETSNRFCTSCGRRFNCKAYAISMAEAMGKTQPLTPDELKALTDEQVMAAHDKANGQYKMMETCKKTLGAHLTNRMAAANVKTLEGEQFKADIRSMTHSAYDVATVMAACGVHGIDPATVFTCNKKNVEAAFGKFPDTMSHLAQQMRHGMTTPYVSIGAASAKKAAKKPRGKKVAEAPASTPVAAPVNTAPAEEGESQPEL